MDDSERYKLRYGPYSAPKCRVGDKLPCEYRGREVTVRRMTEAPIQWPATRGGRNASPIVCADLVRAIRTEAELAVAYHWGVDANTVWKWRRALEVPRMTNGTRRLAIEYALETFTPEVRASAIEALRSPEVQDRLRAIRTGRRADPKTAAALREAARRPKSETWRHAMSRRMQEVWAHSVDHGLPPSHHWTEEEIALLGTDTDQAIADALGVPRYSVTWKRRQLGIASGSPPPQRWTEADIKRLGTAPDPEVARDNGKSTHAVQQKRRILGIPPFEPGWTAEELSWLGIDSDEAVAAAFGRSREAVKIRRRKAGIRIFRWD